MFGCNREVDQVEVQVLELEVLQAVLTCFLDVTVITVPELSQACRGSDDYCSRKK